MSMSNAATVECNIIIDTNTFQVSLYGNDYSNLRDIPGLAMAPHWSRNSLLEAVELSDAIGDILVAHRITFSVEAVP